MQSKRLLTIREAASRLAVREGTLYTWRWKKKGIKFVRVGRALRIGERELESFIRRNTICPTKEKAKE